MAPRMATAPPGATRRASLEPALAAIEAALSVVFARADQVQAACDAIGPGHPAWDRLDDDTATRLTSLLRIRRDPAIAPLVALLREAALSSAEPWAILQPLLASQVEATCAAGLDTALQVARAGRLCLDPPRAGELARIAEQPDSPVLTPACMPRVATLLDHLDLPGIPADRTLHRLFVDAETPALRRLAARVLDAAGTLPSTDLVSRLLTPEDAAVLAPLLTYTRASHLDVQGLVRRAGTSSPIAGCLRAAASQCPPALLADLVSELGWTRVNLGLDLRRVVGVSVDGSLPFELPETMATLVEGRPGARRAYDVLVATAHGGMREAPDKGPPGGDAVARFRAYNLAHADVLGDILDVAPLTVERVRTILTKMDGIVAEFATLFGARSEECATLPALYADLKARIESQLQAATPGQPLSMELTRLVQMFEDPASLARVQTLHGLKRYLHQSGLSLGFGLLESSRGTNRSVDLALAARGRVAAAVRRIEYVSFEADGSDSDAGNGSIPVPYPVAIVAHAFARQLLAGHTTLPRVRIFCYGNEVHYFVSFRNHPVFIRVDYSPPLGGGMIDLAYYGVSKFEIDAHPAPALEGIQAFFRRLDFFVEVDTTRIHARYDKERARDLADICEKAEALFRLVPYLMDVDWTIGSLDLPEEARREVGRAWADLFARWGVLPTGRLLTDDRTGVLAGEELRPEGRRELRWPGTGPYADTVSALPRPELPAEIHAALSARGFDLPLVERERDAGQIAFERHLLDPVRAALDLGELIEGPDGPRRSSPELFRRRHEADAFAELLAGDDERLGRSAHMARLATALERSLTFDTTGSVNGYEVQRALVRLRGESGALFALRDAAGIFRLAVYAPGGVLCLRRATPGDPWRDNATCDVGALASLLRRNNFLPSWIDATADEIPEARHVRDVFNTPNHRARRDPRAGACAVTCMKASPGRGVGRACLGIRGRPPEAFDGAVLFAATLRPEDQPHLHHAVAVVGTGGGILSHAGLMAVQCGRPALIMPGTWREEPDGGLTLRYQRVEFDERARRVDGYEVVERHAFRECEERLREGDLVVVDADEGVLEVLGQQPTALALHDSLVTLDAAERGLGLALDPADVLAQRGRRLRALHQLERLTTRLDDPTLVAHAARALLSPPATPLTEGGRDRARLLALLQSSPVTGAVASECLRSALADLSARHAEAYGQAARLIPRARDATEVLDLWQLALARGDALAQALPMAAACGLPASDVPASVEVDRLAEARLETLHDALARRLSALIETAPLDPVVRHLLIQAGDLADVIDVPATARAVVDRGLRALRRQDETTEAALSARLVLWPSDGGLELAPLAGSKAANLAELARLGAAADVPPWFVVTDRALREALSAPAPSRPGTPWSHGDESWSMAEAIAASVARTDADAEQKASLIQQFWADFTMPAAVRDAVVDAYRRLGPAGEPFVAIRSSAREEDTRAAARAGEFDTFLFVRGEHALVDHLRRAWSGLWTGRAIAERAAGGREGLGEGGGILVQRIVDARVSGVLQTINVAERRTREMVISAGLGLGEGVVSGVVSADHVVVSKDEDPDTEPLRFRYVTADKRERVVFDERRGAGTVRADVLSHQRLRPALEYVELVELVRTATRLEKAYGYPLDMEFGIEGATVWLLQVRPVPGSRSAWRDAVARRRRSRRTASGDADAGHDGHGAAPPPAPGGEARQW